MGKKLFNPENIHETFKLAFYLIGECFTNGERTSSSSSSSSVGRGSILAHSVDLFCNLCEKPSVRASLLAYPELRQSLIGMVGYLENCTARAAAKLLQLLVALASTHVSAATARDGGGGTGDVSMALLIAQTLAKQKTLPVLVKWCCHVGTGQPASLWGLRLLELVVAQVKGGDEGAVTTHFAEVCETMCRDLVAAAGSNAAASKDAALARIVATVATMAASPILQGNTRACIHSQTSKALIDSRTLRSSAAASAGAAAGSAMVVTAALQLLGKTDGPGAAVAEMQRHDVLRTIGRSVANGDPFGVHAVLRLLASVPETVDTLKLADGIVRTLVGTMNARSTVAAPAAAAAAAAPAAPEDGRPMTLSEFGTPHATPLRPSTRANSNSDEVVDPNELADRLVRGLQLKDLRSSEILAIYESKFRDLSQTHRQQVELLDTKTAALQQADSLLAEYRSKSQAMGGQFQEMRVLVQAAETRSEHALAATANQERLAESLRLEKQNLEQTLGETNSNFATMQQELTELQGVKIAHSALIGLSSDLKEQLGKRDALCASQAAQIDTLDAQLVEAGLLCKDLKSAMQQVTAESAEHQQEKAAVQVKLASTTSELASAGAALEKASERADAAEAALKLKEAEMEEAAARIKQLEGVATMIHNLSLGVTNTNAAPQ